MTGVQTCALPISGLMEADSVVQVRSVLLAPLIVQCQPGPEAAEKDSAEGNAAWTAGLLVVAPPVDSTEASMTRL